VAIKTKGNITQHKISLKDFSNMYKFNIALIKKKFVICKF